MLTAQHQIEKAKTNKLERDPYLSSKCCWTPNRARGRGNISSGWTDTRHSVNADGSSDVCKSPNRCYQFSLCQKLCWKTPTSFTPTSQTNCQDRPVSQGLAAVLDATYLPFAKRRRALEAHTSGTVTRLSRVSAIEWIVKLLLLNRNFWHRNHFTLTTALTCDVL